ncbi:hypothetical protein R5R35_014346 [Gryllus longicercus]|uniref:Death domain-containing protein n=2 Tax=Gryllus longicercus TaxID=2509291 RepID=A0AAN9VQW3_9ORTH
MSDVVLVNHTKREKTVALAQIMNETGKAFTKAIQPNPKLEVLREEGLKDPRNDCDINQLLEKTKRIHAGWLFDGKFLPLLQKLLRLLDGNFDTLLTPGWGTFGHHLGLSSEILRVIECSKLGNEGYTYYVLQHYIQKDDSTIEKVVQALVDMKRKDAIHQTFHLFNSLADDILRDHQGNRQEHTSNNERSDEENRIDSGFSNDEEADEQIFNQREQTVESVIRPNFIPTPPLILQVLKEHVHRASRVSVSPRSPKVEHQCIQNSAPTNMPRNVQVVQINNTERTQQQKKVKPKYDCIVMLTFADDGINHATQIAQSLRAKREDGQIIGVLILNDHENDVSFDPELFISGTFPQVNYVIPIITEGYLKAIVDLRPPLQFESTYIDCKYTRFIYTLMKKYYVNNGCLNKKIRCVIPDDLTHLTKKTLMRDPVFETWVKSSSIGNLADRMLWRCKRKRNNRQQIIES